MTTLTKDDVYFEARQNAYDEVSKQKAVVTKLARALERAQLDLDEAKVKLRRLEQQYNDICSGG